MVSELVSAREPVRVQRGWVLDAKLHSHAGHDDPGVNRWRLGSPVTTQISNEAILDCGRIRHRARTGSALLAHLPRSETDLDTLLDDFQRRDLLSVSCGIRVDHRSKGISEVDFSSSCNWNEFHRGLLHCSFA